MGSAWDSSERILRPRAEVRVGRRRNLPPTPDSGVSKGNDSSRRLQPLGVSQWRRGSLPRLVGV